MPKAFDCDVDISGDLNVIGFLAAPNVPLILDRLISQSVLSNDNTLTSMYSYDIRNSDINNHCFRLTIGGYYENITGSNQTLLVRIDFGGLAIYNSTTLNLASSSRSRAWELSLIMTSRVTNEQSGIGKFAMSGAATTAVGIGPLSVVGALSSPILVFADADTSGAGNTSIALKLQHSAANAALVVTVENALLERL